MTHRASPAAPSLTDLVEMVRSGDPGGMEGLYRLFARGIRFYLWRHFGSQDLEDKVHDTFLIVVEAIRKGELREPGRLMGFVRTVLRRQVAAHIDRVVQYRKQQADLHSDLEVIGPENPEQDLIDEQRHRLMLEILNGISLRDREILTRFYLQGQPQERICEEMGLSTTQFRLLKSRAKARFGELGRRKLRQRALLAFPLRISPGLAD